MFKKILIWSIYAGVVGLLIYGAVIRTEAKTQGNKFQPEGRLEDESLGQEGGGGGWSRNGEESRGRAGEGSGRNGSSSGSGDEVNLAEDQEHDWISLAGVVSNLDAESLWIETGQAENLEITGRTWLFISESDILISIGDQVELSGFYEDDEFELALIQDLTTGAFLQVRENSGRPLWSGRRGR